MKISNTQRIPEILAPAGGMEQFYAAVRSGADAVYLGLQEFNARARAKNFSWEELALASAVAKKHNIKILVTLNILIKDVELQHLIRFLSRLQEIEVHALIVQDLGLLSLLKKHFPDFRIHASTQMAVHNSEGVKWAREQGIKRVVLARELTAREIKDIRKEHPRSEVELEVFCHGSLCYSYSGLCFFSGAEDSRSGNRGECAYTCREPYKIISEPGHGALFSMKDLDTSESVETLIDCGVDTLKIEGRKKDPQYVMSSVKLYREKLALIFGAQNLRPLPQGVSELEGEGKWNLQNALSFKRQETTFFLKGRYVENVIDLDNARHKGVLVGNVVSVSGSLATVEVLSPLEKYDGVRFQSAQVDYFSKPQHGEEKKSDDSALSRRYEQSEDFSLRAMLLNGKSVFEVGQGETVDIEFPSRVPTPQIGDFLFQVRSDKLKKQAELYSKPLIGDDKESGRQRLDLAFSLIEEGPDFSLQISASLHGHVFLTKQYLIETKEPARSKSLKEILPTHFEIFGESGFVTQQFHFFPSEEKSWKWFINPALLKNWKRDFGESLLVAFETRRELFEKKVMSEVLSTKHGESISQQLLETCVSLFIDRLEFLDYLEPILSSTETNTHWKELIFEPKKTFLDSEDISQNLEKLTGFCEKFHLRFRLSVPMVLRAWDKPWVKKWIETYSAMEKVEVTHFFQVGNVGSLQFLKDHLDPSIRTDISADFSLYALNREASYFLLGLGLSKICLSLEDDKENLESQIRALPENFPLQVILYRDTPLFIAESCSLTALHGGCPTAKVCGYRTLEIQNQKGETFFVAHEACKSIVYGEKAYAVGSEKKRLETWGVRDFRIDLITRNYNAEEVAQIVKTLLAEKNPLLSHTANFHRTLL